MCPLSNTAGSDSDSSSSSQNRAAKIFTSAYEVKDKQFYKDLFNKADSVPLPMILNHYGIKIDAFNKKIICPFPSHSNGRESTPSFYYYPETNSFWCFGCKAGTKSSIFVSNMENISRTQAAFKIIEGFDEEDFLLKENSEIDFSQRTDIIMKFSSMIREFILINLDDINAINFIEKISFSFDKMNEKYSLDNEALDNLVIKLKDKISQFTGEI